MNEVFAAIESPETDAFISSESSLRRMFLKLESNPSVRQLVRALQGGEIQPEIVLSRMGKLASRTIDFRFRNPSDTALAAYLYAIAVATQDSLYLACRIALVALNTWLSKRIVEGIIGKWSNDYTSSTQYFALPPEYGLKPGVFQGRQFADTFNDFIQIPATFSEKPNLFCSQDSSQ